MRDEGGGQNRLFKGHQLGVPSVDSLGTLVRKETFWAIFIINLSKSACGIDYMTCVEYMKSKVNNDWFHSKFIFKKWTSGAEDIDSIRNRRAPPPSPSLSIHHIYSHTRHNGRFVFRDCINQTILGLPISHSIHFCHYNLAQRMIALNRGKSRVSNKKSYPGCGTSNDT